jgi:hypothetical protein
MPDAVNFLVPADERFRDLGPELSGKYVVAAGGTVADAGLMVDAAQAAVETVTAGVPGSEGVEWDFRSPAGVVEVTVRCHGKSSVVTQALPASPSP